MPAAPSAPRKRLPRDVRVVLLGDVAVAVVAVVVILVHVVGGSSSSRPSVKETLDKLVLRESQVPSGYKLADHMCSNAGPGDGLKGCFAANYRRVRDNSTRQLGSAATSFVDSTSASNFVREVKDQIAQTAVCTRNREPLPRSELTVVDLPSPGLGDESAGVELKCPTYRGTGDAYVWRVGDIVQVVIGPEGKDTMKDLAKKIEAHK